MRPPKGKIIIRKVGSEWVWVGCVGSALTFPVVLGPVRLMPLPVAIQAYAVCLRRV